MKVSCSAGRSPFAAAACVGSFGRKSPTLAKMSCASCVCRYATNAVAMSVTQSAAAFLSTTTAGFWIRIVEDGYTIVSSLPAAWARSTWFS